MPPSTPSSRRTAIPTGGSIRPRPWHAQSAMRAAISARMLGARGQLTESVEDLALPAGEKELLTANPFSDYVSTSEQARPDHHGDRRFVHRGPLRPAMLCPCRTLRLARASSLRASTGRRSTAFIPTRSGGCRTSDFSSAIRAPSRPISPDMSMERPHLRVRSLLVLGGARSGKSAYAQRLAEACCAGAALSCDGDGGRRGNGGAHRPPPGRPGTRLDDAGGAARDRPRASSGGAPGQGGGRRLPDPMAQQPHAGRPRSRAGRRRPRRSRSAGSPGPRSWYPTKSGWG